jgi:hypothetical protein
MSMHRTERMFGVEASEGLRRATMRNFFRCGLQELDLENFALPGPAESF